MFAKSSLAVLVSAAVVLAQGQPSINTPSGVQECLPTLFTVSGGTPPYTVTFSQGPGIGGTTLKEFFNVTGPSFTWVADLQANTQFIANIKDANGQQNQSGAISVGTGPNRDCEDTNITGSISQGTIAGGGSGTQTTAGGSTTTGGTTTTGTNTAPGTSSTGGSSSSRSSATTTNTGAAAPLQAGSLAFTGVLGFLASILL